MSGSIWAIASDFCNEYLGEFCSQAVSTPGEGWRLVCLAAWRREGVEVQIDGADLLEQQNSAIVTPLTRANQRKIRSLLNDLIALTGRRFQSLAIDDS